MTVAVGRLQSALEQLRCLGEPAAVEPEGFPLLDAIGVACPKWIVVESADDLDLARLAAFTSSHVVVKVAASDLPHRSDVGGVAVVVREVAAVRTALASMAARLAGPGRRRFTISEFVPHHAGPGGELLASLRWTADFGPVVTLGPGGIYAEVLARHLPEGRDVAVFAASEVTRRQVIARMRDLPFVDVVTGRLRRQPALTSPEAIADVLVALAALGREACPVPVQECEINPLAVTAAGLMALDVLVKTASSAPPVADARPLHKLAALLAPRSIAVAGVSEHLNPGRIILENLLRDGFPRDRIRVVKPGVDAIEGCVAVGSIAELPAAVDLLVLAVPARHVPAMLIDAIDHERAESIIVIPGGLEEKAGGAAALAPVREVLARARRSTWRGPVINGGNCLGIRSRPGRYDTMFIPPHKMPAPAAAVSPLALVTQSGAFAVARLGKLGPVNPKYVVTVGNQMDLTVGDYLTWLADDRALRVFGVYLEGFRPGDGLRLVQAARRITESGRLVIMLRAGRTPAGAAASASHTAAMAGDYVVARELARVAGVWLVDSLDAFEDAVRVALALEGRRPRGLRLGVVSNAGFECVAAADHLGPLTLATFSSETRRGLARVFAEARLDAVVDVHNPLDLTPMAGDAVFVDAARLVLEDEGLDLGLVGCVPLTPALDTLPAAPEHAEDVTRPGGVAAGLASLWRTTEKPWVIVVDAGPQYDRMAHILESAGLVVFRTADRALRALTAFCRVAGPGIRE
jgi:acyl-CoA synthetase (NDP forming)